MQLSSDFLAVHNIIRSLLEGRTRIYRHNGTLKLSKDLYGRGVRARDSQLSKHPAGASGYSGPIHVIKTIKFFIDSQLPPYVPDTIDEVGIDTEMLVSLMLAAGFYMEEGPF